MASEWLPQWLPRRLPRSDSKRHHQKRAGAGTPHVGRISAARPPSISVTWWEAGGGDQAVAVGLAPGVALAAAGVARAPAMKPSNGSADVLGTLARQVQVPSARVVPAKAVPTHR